MTLRQARELDPGRHRRPIEDREQDITSRLSQRGAMLSELRSLMRTVGPDLDRSRMRHAVVDKNILNKASVNAREYTFKKLSTRYFPEHMPNATSGFVSQFVAEDDTEQQGLLAYLMLLWTDGLMWELGRRWLVHRLAIVGYEPTPDEVEEQVDYLRRDDPRTAGWTSQTCGKIASNYLNSLRDCGLASGRAKKLLRQPYVAPATVGFGALLVAGSGTPTHEVAEQEIFRFLGLTPVDVIEALKELDHAGWIKFRVQGGVVVLDFEPQR